MAFFESTVDFRGGGSCRFRLQTSQSEFSEKRFRFNQRKSEIDHDLGRARRALSLFAPSQVVFGTTGAELTRIDEIAIGSPSRT